MKQAIIEAGAVRTTPILLTTGAVVIGAQSSCLTQFSKD